MRKPTQVTHWATSDGQEFADKEVTKTHESSNELYAQYVLTQRQAGGHFLFIEWILENFEPKKETP